MPQNIYCCGLTKIKFCSGQQTTCLDEDNKIFSEERRLAQLLTAMDWGNFSKIDVKNEKIKREYAKMSY